MPTATPPRRTAVKPATKPQKTLQDRMLERLALSVMTPKDAAALHLQPYTAAQVVALKLKYNVAGFKIPYFDFDGNPVPFYRFRYLDDTRTRWQVLAGERPVRYIQPPATAPELYLPPYVHWAALFEDTDATLVFTEGELKAACATKHGVPTIGLGGVWSFKSKNLRKTLLDAFKHINLLDRRCIICFDSDAATNPDIRRAEQAFARELMQVGAQVFIARLPALPDGAKCGLDDFIALHKGSTAALEQLLAGAESYTAAEKLHALNEEVLVINNPGFVWRLADNLPLTVADFKALHYAHWQYMDYSDPEKPKLRSAPEAWLKWPHRACVAGMAYEPGQPRITVDNHLNQWRGWGGEPRKGNVDAWHRLLDHLFAHHVKEREWFEQWAAYPIQYPGTKHHTAVVMWGRETGTGKSLLAYTLGGVYGENFVEIGDNELDPNKDFNGWAENKQFVLADDITGHNNRKLANRLKTMISRERMQVNIKFVKTYDTADHLNYYFTSNDPDAFYLDEKDRRFFIHEAVGGKLPDAVRDACLELRATGIDHLLYHLLNVDTSNFDSGADAPVTAAKVEMQGLVRTDLETWLDNAMSNPDAYFKGFRGDLMTLEEIHTCFDPTATKRDISSSLIGRKLATLGAVRLNPVDSTSGQVRCGGKLQRLYAVRNHRQWLRVTTAAAREYYEKHRSIVRGEDKKPKF